MSKNVTIALIWHSMNSDNLGVGALTLANIALLRKAAAAAGRTPRFLIVAWRDPGPWYEEPEDVENRPVRLRHLVSPGGPFGLALSEADIAFDIGAGDSFTDIYGAKRFFSTWITKIRAALRGVPQILAPQTIGPFDTAWARPLARFAMNRMDHVVTRDSPSSEFVRELGIRAPLLEATDVAMALPANAAMRPAGGDGGITRVGLNVSGLLFNGGYTQANQFGLRDDYPALMRRMIDWFLEQPGVELHLVPHVLADAQPVEDDRKASLALAEEFPGIVVAPVFRNPVDIKGYISGMDFFAGSRMHATIAAFSSGVPVVPLAYSRKFRGVFGTLGYPHVADLKSETADEIMVRIETGFRNRDSLAAEVAEAAEGVTARLDAYVDLARRAIEKL